MRFVIQRVTQASVTVADDGKKQTIGEIGQGLLILAGFGRDDSADLPSQPVWKKMLSKVVDLRIFPDSQGKMNQSLADKNGDLLLISQFTLYADCKKGRRPSFTKSCPPNIAEPLYDTLKSDLATRTPRTFASGTFGAEMLLDFTNWGPVTIILDSEDM